MSLPKGYDRNVVTKHLMETEGKITTGGEHTCLINGDHDSTVNAAGWLLSYMDAVEPFWKEKKSDTVREQARALIEKRESGGEMTEEEITSMTLALDARSARLIEMINEAAAHKNKHWDAVLADSGAMEYPAGPALTVSDMMEEDWNTFKAACEQEKSSIEDDIKPKLAS